MPAIKHFYKTPQVLFFLFIFTFFSLYLNASLIKTRVSQILPQALEMIPTIPIPHEPKIIDHYSPPLLNKSDSYTLIFIGDSMTAALGSNFDQLRIALTHYYPKTTFGLFNYGYGSSNILSAQQRLLEATSYNAVTSPAILDRQSDIIVIESFGHNPLSQFPLEEGLKQQTKALDLLVAQIVDKKPNTLIIFLATIAPSKKYYNFLDKGLTPQVRAAWADERIAYIQNHINYASSHNIPLIDVYKNSLDEKGDALLNLINKDDYIHPSAAGVKFISQQIADYFFKNNIFPQ